MIEPRTGHFRGFVGFEAKGKDLSFAAKAKDFKMCPQGRPRGQGKSHNVTMPILVKLSFFHSF